MVSETTEFASFLTRLGHRQRVLTFVGEHFKFSLVRCSFIAPFSTLGTLITTLALSLLVLHWD